MNFIKKIEFLFDSIIVMEDIRSYLTSFVTFDDGAKGEIKGVGKLACTDSLDLIMFL